MNSESSTQWKSCPPASSAPNRTAGTSCTPRLSVACCMRVISVMTAPASMASAKERTDTPSVA